MAYGDSSVLPNAVQMLSSDVCELSLHSWST